MTEILKVKIDSLPELMNDIFKFFENNILHSNKFAIQAREAKQQNMAQKHTK